MNKPSRKAINKIRSILAANPGKSLHGHRGPDGQPEWSLKPHGESDQLTALRRQAQMTFLKTVELDRADRLLEQGRRDIQLAELKARAFRAGAGL